MKTFSLKNIFVFFVFVFVSHNAMALCVTNPYANMRAGPGIQHKQTWKVYQYMPFKVIKSSKDWYQVEDLDGDSHWILATLTSKNIKCGVTIGDNTAIYTQADENSPTTTWSPQGKNYSVKILETQGDWVKVVDIDGDTGWIQSSQLWIQ